MDAPQPNPVIRHATSADVDAVVAIFAGPRVAWGTLQLPYPSPEVWRQRLTEPERGWVPLVACVDGQPVGMLGLHTHPDMPRLRHSAWLGMAVRDDWQGRGIGTALLVAGLDLADHWLQLTRMELHVFVDNEPALRLYRRYGFVVEGTLRRAAFREGTLHDVHLMARLRETPPGQATGDAGSLPAGGAKD